MKVLSFNKHRDRVELEQVSRMDAVIEHAHGQMVDGCVLGYSRDGQVTVLIPEGMERQDLFLLLSQAQFLMAQEEY